MTCGVPADLPYGGSCAWRLAPDATCAKQARSALSSVLRTLGYGAEAVDNAVLAVSELAGNAYQHASRPRPNEVAANPELWVWARTRPRPELMVAVFDGCPVFFPAQQAYGPLSESGRGLGIVSVLSSCWGVRRSLSRVTRPAVRGKATWFALPLPANWPYVQQPVHPAVAAQRLLLALRDRGINGSRRSHTTGISVVMTGTVNIWVDHRSSSWVGVDGKRRACPVTDIQETAELVIQYIEESRPPGPPGRRSP